MGGQRGRPVIGALAGLLLGLFLAVDLLLLGTIPVDNAMVVILPLLGLLAGLAVGLMAPLGFLRRS